MKIVFTLTLALISVSVIDVLNLLPHDQLAEKLALINQKYLKIFTPVPG